MRRHPQQAAVPCFANCCFTIKRILIKQNLLAKGVAEVAGRLEGLNVAFLRDVAETDLAVDDEVDISNGRILLVQLLSPPDLDHLAVVKDHLERIEGHFPEPWVVQPYLLQQQVLLRLVVAVHHLAVLVDDVAHRLVFFRRERVHLMGFLAQLLQRPSVAGVYFGLRCPRLDCLIHLMLSLHHRHR